VGLSGCVAADLDPPRSLLSEHIVFRSPFLQSAIAGATCDLVLSQVVQIVENFRYPRSFIVAPTTPRLEFAPVSANGRSRH
jgi:hypothetical protein